MDRNTLFILEFVYVFTGKDEPWERGRFLNHESTKNHERHEEKILGEWIVMVVSICERGIKTMDSIKGRKDCCPWQMAGKDEPWERGRFLNHEDTKNHEGHEETILGENGLLCLSRSMTGV